MNAYFFKMSKEEKSNILDQHKSLYDGYVTKYNQETNKSPLYVQDFANDKNGITLNNKGEVKPYTNFKINESPLDRIADGPVDLKNGTVDIDSVEDTNEDNVEFMHDVLPSPNEDEFDYETFGKFADEMKNNDDQYEYDIDKLEDYSTDGLYSDNDETEDGDFGFESPFCKSCEGTGCEECDGSGMKRNQIGLEGDDVEFEGDGENSEIGTEEELNFDWLNSYQDDVDDEDLPNVVSSITESLDMFKRFKKYN